MIARHAPISVVLGFLAAVCTLSGSGCTAATPQDPTGSATANPSQTLSGPTSTPPSSYATIAELAKALNDKGIACVLSYPGLKDDASHTELSICTIENEQAFLRVWQTPDLVQKFLASPDGQSGTLAVGTNWTISFQTSATAAKVATALGGSAPGSSSSSSATLKK